MYGPTGVGVLYGKEQWLDRLPPYQGGGEMIGTVSWEKTTYNELPFKFEAGTPDYVATHGLATAIDYMTSIGIENIQAHETELTRYCMEQMATIEGIKIYGPQLPSAHHPSHSVPDGFAAGHHPSLTAPANFAAGPKDAVVSFNVGDIHHLDLGTLLDRLGIAVRTGHHCAQPLMDRLGISGTVRASFALYNTKDEVDALVAGIRRVAQMF
jgi:cysteine desulfurase/selenocysteine lyase